MNNEEKELVKKTFSRTAEKYVTSEIHAKGDDLELLVDWLQPASHWIALDIATGGGHVAKALSPFVDHILATDLTPGMLTAASNHLVNSGCNNISYVIADAESLPFLNDSFGLVTCRIAPHHFPNPQHFIKEVSRVLRPGGLFLLIDNVAPDDDQLALFMNTVEKMRDESHVRCPSVQEWSDWLRDENLMEQKSRIRKKVFAFPQWVERTANSTQQMYDVEQFLLQARSDMHDFFSIEVEDNRVVSWQTDEWMVICKKTSD